MTTLLTKQNLRAELRWAGYRKERGPGQVRYLLEHKTLQCWGCEGWTFESLIENYCEDCAEKGYVYDEPEYEPEYDRD
jgi:hypothetical protein